MVCFDTSFIIDLLREKKSGDRGPATRKLDELSVGDSIPRTTIITLAELFVGPYRVRNGASEMEKVERIAGGMEILDLTREAAKRFGYIVADLYQKGTPIGAMDVFISAIVLSNGETLITRNTRDFERVEGLKVEGY